MNFKTITGIGAIGLIVVAAIFIWQFFELRSDKAGLEWQLSIANADRDTIYLEAEYSPPDTVWRTVTRTKIDTIFGKVDTVQEDIADIRGYISFDTTKFFGSESNPLSVRVAGRLYYPDEFRDRNTLLIIPQWGKPPTKAATGRSRSFALGVGMLVQTPLRADFGLQVRYKRLSTGIYRRIGGSGWTVSLGYEIIRF